MFRNRVCPVLGEVAHQYCFGSESCLGFTGLRAEVAGYVVFPGREVASVSYHKKVPDDYVGDVFAEEGVFHLLDAFRHRGAHGRSPCNVRRASVPERAGRASASVPPPLPSREVPRPQGGDDGPGEVSWRADTARSIA